jgi:hypothetical protein
MRQATQGVVSTVLVPALIRVSALAAAEQKGRSKMGPRVIEKLDGTGMILKPDGSVLGERKYHLVVLEELTDVGGGQIVAGIPDIQGRIELQNLEGTALVMKGEKLTLKLTDGRSLPFFVSDGDGTIAPAGNME